MREIYIVGKTYKNKTGGPASVIRGLCSALKNRGVEVNVLCLNEKFGLSSLIKNLLKILFFKRNCVVNVHTDGLKLPRLVYWFSRIDKKNAYYLTVHGLYYIESKINSTYKKKYANIEKKLLKKFPNLICVSELLKKKIEEDIKRGKNVYVVPNGIDVEGEEVNYNVTDKFKFPIKLLMLGGIRERKGIFECVEVVKYLTENGLNVNLNVYGADGADGLRLKFLKYVEDLELTDKVFYRANLFDKHAVYKVIKESDLQLCLSKWDTFNVAIIESLALGTPCVVTDMCGAACAITEDNGVVISLDGCCYPDKIKDFITKLYKNENNELVKLSESSSDIIKRYNWKEITDCYLETINYFVE